MSQQSCASPADIFGTGFQFGANPFAAFMMPGNGASALPRMDAMMPAMPMMMAPGFDAVLKGMARWNLELAGFMSRRAQAYLEIPARLSQCRTPNDLVREQTQFWRTSMEQYADTSRRLTSVATQMMAGASASAPKSPPRKRDYINVPGLGDPAPVSGNNGGRPERRVA